MADVAVTRVTVDYAFDGKAFTVVFANPSEIRSIILERDELNKLKVALNARHEVTLDPLTAIVPTPQNGQAAGKETGTDSSVAAPSRGLWWHTGACTFFHPEKA